MLFGIIPIPSLIGVIVGVHVAGWLLWEARNSVHIPTFATGEQEFISTWDRDADDEYGHYAP